MKGAPLVCGVELADDPPLYTRHRSLSQFGMCADPTELSWENLTYELEVW